MRARSSLSDLTSACDRGVCRQIPDDPDGTDPIVHQASTEGEAPPDADTGGGQPPVPPGDAFLFGRREGPLELTAGPVYPALEAAPPAPAEPEIHLNPPRSPDGFAVNSIGVTTRANYVNVVDANGNTTRILRNVSAGADHLADVRSRTDTTGNLGPYREGLRGFYNNRVAHVAEKTPPLIDLYRFYAGPNAAPPPVSGFALQLPKVIRYVRALFSIAHDGHAHPEGYDARKGNYYRHLVNMAGRYSEVLVCGIPQGCGVGHYTHTNSPPLSYAGARALDQRHIDAHRTMRANYAEWATLMRGVARHDPTLAASMDRAAFLEDHTRLAELVGQLPEGASMNGKRIQALAKEEPRHALVAHLSLTGFDPADPRIGALSPGEPRRELLRDHRRRRNDAAERECDDAAQDCR